MYFNEVCTESLNTKLSIMWLIRNREKKKIQISPGLEIKLKFLYLIVHMMTLFGNHCQMQGTYRGVDGLRKQPAIICACGGKKLNPPFPEDF